MLEINLLPWRQDKRERKRKQRKLLLAMGVFLPIVFFGLEHFVLSGYVENQVGKIRDLENQVLATEQQQRNPNNETTDGIVELNQERNDLLQRLVTLSQNNVDGFRLIKMEYEQKKINLIGYVKSVEDISQWVSVLTAESYAKHLADTLEQKDKIMNVYLSN